jgi:PAS domain S-box-containing protein
VPKRTPAEDRRSRPTEPAIPDESIRSTGLSAASVLAAHLRASDPYLAESQQLSHTGSFGWKPSTGEIIWSDETFRIFQYDRATVPTVERVLQRVHPEDRARVQEMIDRAAQTGKDVDFEHRLLMPDGSVRHLHVVARARSDESGRLEFAGAVMDVTEHREDRKRAEEELSRQERELREIVDLVPHHIAVATPDGTLVYGNHVFLDYYGLTNEDLQDSETAVLARRFTHPDDIEPFLVAWQRGSAGIAPWETEARFRRRDGEYRWLLIRGTPLRDDGGRPVRWYVTGTDIDERKRGEELLTQKEKELRDLVDSVPQHIVTLDPNGRRLYANRASLDYYGCTIEEFRAPDFLRTVCHPDHIDDLQRDRQQLARGEPFDVETRTRAKDGSSRWFLVRYRPFRDEDGRIARWYITTVDIEDRRRTEERLQTENLALREELERVSMFDEIVGTSAPLRAVLASLSRVAPTESTVLITGETGTGKELVARAIHKRSSRSSRPFVSVNCAAIPPTLITSELFGHEKGAFTGALTRRLGRFELADGGTIFLDEIGDLQPDTQLTLLRVLQEREFERLGSTRPIKVDVRIVAATNRDLKAAMASGAFRADLFYRLSVFPIEMPPLRKRTTDIPLLVAYFADRYASNAGKSIRHVDKRTLDLVRSYRWPGNVRELQNVIERAVIVCETETLVVDENWLSMETLATQPPVLPLGDALVGREREMIEAALAETRGKVAGRSGAAARLGLPPSTLESKIRALKIRKDQYKQP